MNMLAYLKMTMFVILFGLKFLILAQTFDNASIDIADATPPDSPIKVVLGHISFVGSHWEMHLELRNASPKTIIAYQVSIDLSGYGSIVHMNCEDDFFDENLKFISDSKISVDNTFAFNITVPQGPVQPPSLSLKYVNFADGTHYGSSEWGENLRDGRAAAEVRMNELLKVYQEKGKDAFEARIKKTQNRPEDPRYVRDFMSILDYKLNKIGADKLIAAMKKNLNVAQQRENIR
jgi:hypothetical protein